MTTLTLTNVTLNINNVNLQDVPQMPIATPSTTTKSLYVNAQVMVGDKVISAYGNSFTLTAAELSGTSLDEIEALAVTKVKADLGIA